MSSAREVWELSRAILADKPGYIAVLKVYMDESGIHDGSPALTVGAYVAMPRVWREWTKVWNRRKRPIEVFHSNDCANLWGEFKGWKPPERDAFVAQLLPTIAEHPLAAFVAGIKMNDFRDVCEEYPRMGEALGTPYVACFQWVVTSILQWLDTIPDSQRLAFFHENNDYIGETTSCFGLCRELGDKGNRKMSLTFGAKEDYVALQAADVLAYEGNKRIRNPDTPDRRAWRAINPNGDRRELKYFDRKALLALAKDRYAA